MAEQRLTAREDIRLTPAEAGRITRLVARTPLRRSVLVRQALALGLELIEQDPALIVKRPQVAAGGGA